MPDGEGQETSSVVSTDEILTLDKLASGDRPSLYMLGLVASQSLRKNNIAVFMTDVLGGVRLMPMSSIAILHKVSLTDVELNELEERTAIDALVAQGEGDDFIVAYLQRRQAGGGQHG